jgi:uncharacterized membrane protein YfcA
MSLAYVVLAVIAFFWLRRIRTERPFVILAGDIALIALVLSYRAWKQLASASQPLWMHRFTWACFFAFILAGFFSGFLGRDASRSDEMVGGVKSAVRCRICKSIT